MIFLLKSQADISAFSKDPNKFTAEFIEYARRIKNGALSILNTLAVLSDKYGGLVYASQSFIAEHSNGRNHKTGMTREWTCKQIKMLVEAGLVVKKRRGIKKTCLYALAPLFSYPMVRAALADMITAFQKVYLIGFLFVSYYQLYEQLCQKSSNFTQYKVFNLLNKRNGNGVRACEREESFSVIKNDSVADKVEASGMSNHDPSTPKGYVETSVPLFTTGVEKVATVIPLTLAGKVKVAAFDDRVLLDALYSYNKSSATIRDPFNWFIKTCGILAAKRNLTPDLQKERSLQKQLNITDAMPRINMVEKPTIAPKIEEVVTFRHELNSKPAVDRAGLDPYQVWRSPVEDSIETKIAVLEKRIAKCARGTSIPDRFYFKRYSEELALLKSKMI
jgi:hypothetical protein